ncbi:hypothetical protein [Streptomyces sp. M2CJ-2]|nr:hypothetical protein [Streptomyces sp. M2CJ-2]
MAEEVESGMAMHLTHHLLAVDVDIFDVVRFGRDVAEMFGFVHR